MKKVRAIAATGNLSTGFREESLVRAVRQGADFVGCDAGTTDSGPYHLGSGQPRGPREGIKRNLHIMLREALSAGIPVIIGSAGLAGGRPHLQWTVDIVRELAREHQWHFLLAQIDSELEKDDVLDALQKGKISPLAPAPPLNESVIRGANRLVAMMGIEPIQCALKKGAQVVIAGRCSDVAIYAALPILNGIPRAVAFHAGKILECGAASVAQRLYPDCMASEMDEDGFTVEPPNPELRCTPQSVIAHTLYENADPYRLVESGGTLDTSRARYEAIGDRTVRVTGSQFVPTDRYTVRLEGAALVGYRSIVIAGIRDPLLIGQLDSFLSSLRTVVERKVQETLRLKPNEYEFTFRVYGRNGCLGQLEPVDQISGHEIGLIIDVVGRSQREAAELALVLSHTGLHHPIPEWQGLISNFAFPFSPPVIDVGPVYQFCINHVWELENACDPFKMIFESL